MAFTARANRAFLGRVVRYLAAEAGIRQFLDIGTGIPTAGNTHQVAQAIAPESRVVYVDYDPIVLAHARALLTSTRGRRHRVHRRRPARHRHDPRAGRRAAGLHPAGGGHADRDPARDTGLRRPARDRGQADRTPCRPAATSPSPTWGRISSTRRRSRASRDVADRMMQQQFTCPQPRAGGAVLRRARTWSSPVSCGSRNGARSPGRTTRRKSSLWCAVGRQALTSPPAANDRQTASR